MILKERIPEEFYKLFNTRNRDFYMDCILALYLENNRLVSSFGLTEGESRVVVDEVIARSQLLWQDEELEEEGEEENSQGLLISSATIVGRFIKWGWIRKNYDEKLNENVISFPEYSQLYVELFEKLFREDDGKERQSILSIYSTLYTYSFEKEKDIKILETALSMSRNLSQMVSNMQDGMRNYFEELSCRTDFIGIQKVLIDEINNSDSKRYAILTTSDSFYRYKENVKELISTILRQNDKRRAEIEQQLEHKQKNGDDTEQLKDSEYEKKNDVEHQMEIEYGKRALALCDSTNQLVYRIEREFDLIEQKYNKLIEQKTVFAKRALARIHYILQEGVQDENSMINLVNIIGSDDDTAKEVLGELRGKLHLSSRFKLVSDNSFYVPKMVYEKEEEDTDYIHSAPEHMEISDFVPKPIYSTKELHDFRDKNTRDGEFRVTKDSVESVEDLEKLLLLWQEATESRTGDDNVELGEEFTSAAGYTFSSFRYKDK